MIVYGFLMLVLLLKLIDSVDEEKILFLIVKMVVNIGLNLVCFFYLVKVGNWVCVVSILLKVILIKKGFEIECEIKVEIEGVCCLGCVVVLVI